MGGYKQSCEEMLYVHLTLDSTHQHYHIGDPAEVGHIVIAQGVAAAH